MPSPETIKGLWPEDPRYGDGAAPLRHDLHNTGLSYDDRLVDYVLQQQHLVRRFEEKYPDDQWWTTHFVNARPVVALTLNTVNEPLAGSLFTVHARYQLYEVVCQGGSGNGSEFFATTDDQIAANVARLAVSELIQTEDQLAIAQRIMTGQDKAILSMLLRGVSFEGIRSSADVTTSWVGVYL